jgi:Protein of unknown function (DUF2510)
MAGVLGDAVDALPVRPSRSGGLVGRRLAAALVLVLAMPGAACWLLGDWTPHEPKQWTYDYGPYRMNTWAEGGLGLVAVCLVLWSGIVLIRDTRLRRLDRTWWLPLSLALAAGVVSALAWRAATEGYVGATIGGGAFALVVGLGLAGLLAAAAAAGAIALVGSGPSRGWYPIDEQHVRYWDGQEWTTFTAVRDGLLR